MFNVTFNNISVISWQSVLLVEETRVFGWKVTWHDPIWEFAKCMWITKYFFTDRRDGTVVGFTTTCAISAYHLLTPSLFSFQDINNLIKIKSLIFRAWDV
jgi:hypothetical protein